MGREALQKFEFGLSFDEILSEEAEQAQRQMEIQNVFAKGEKKGRDEGEKIGFQKAQETIEARILEELGTLSGEMRRFFELMDAKRDENACLTLELLKLMGKKFFMEPILEEKINLIEKALIESLPLVVEEAKIRLSLPQELVEPLQKRLHENNDFMTLIPRLELSGLINNDNSQHLGRLQWKKGELEINPEHLWTKIDGIFDNYLKVTQKLRHSTLDPNDKNADIQEKEDIDE